jgi:hypothetical protein
MQISDKTSEQDLITMAYSGGSGASVEAVWELQRRAADRTAKATEQYAAAAVKQATWTKALGVFTLVLTASALVQALFAALIYLKK